jgi:hypothetical protein
VTQAGRGGRDLGDGSLDALRERERRFALRGRQVEHEWQDGAPVALDAAGERRVGGARARLREGEVDAHGLCPALREDVEQAGVHVARPRPSAEPGETVVVDAYDDDALGGRLRNEQQVGERALPDREERHVDVQRGHKHRGRSEADQHADERRAALQRPESARPPGVIRGCYGARPPERCGSGEPEGARPRERRSLPARPTTTASTSA